MTLRIGGQLRGLAGSVCALVAVLLLVGLGVGSAGAERAVAASETSAPVTLIFSATSSSHQTLASGRASTPAPGVAERRQAPAKAVTGARSVSSWASVQPEPAVEAPASGWLPPPGRVAAAVGPGPAVIALTIRVSHSGRAPPAGVLLT